MTKLITIPERETYFKPYAEKKNTKGYKGWNLSEENRELCSICKMPLGLHLWKKPWSCPEYQKIEF